MPKQPRTYTISLSEIDRIKVRQLREGPDVLEFGVVYQALINSRWRTITRYDNAHGYPHRHVYYPHSREYKHAMSNLDNNQAFTEAQAVIKKNFMSMKDTYILSLDRSMDGGEP